MVDSVRQSLERSDEAADALVEGGDAPRVALSHLRGDVVEDRRGVGARLVSVRLRLGQAEQVVDQDADDAAHHSESAAADQDGYDVDCHLPLLHSDASSLRTSPTTSSEAQIAKPKYPNRL